jgi:hypothetical protein
VSDQQPLVDPAPDAVISDPGERPGAVVRARRRASQAKDLAEEWRKRVERWRESGLTAEQFAVETGINAGTLRFWSYRIAKEARGEALTPRRRKSPAAIGPAPFVEVRGAEVASTGFELELGNGRRLRVPTSFDAGALARLLGVLESK